MEKAKAYKIELLVVDFENIPEDEIIYLLENVRHLYPSVSSVNKPTDDFMDKMVSELKGKTLYDVCVEWNDDDSYPPVSDLIGRITEWLPKEQSANSQNAYVECSVEAYNDCIRQIKSRLR